MRRMIGRASRATSDASATKPISLRIPIRLANNWSEDAGTGRARNSCASWRASRAASSIGPTSQSRSTRLFRAITCSRQSSVVTLSCTSWRWNASASTGLPAARAVELWRRRLWMWNSVGHRTGVGRLRCDGGRVDPSKGELPPSRRWRRTAWSSWPRSAPWGGITERLVRRSARHLVVAPDVLQGTASIRTRSPIVSRPRT